MRYLMFAFALLSAPAFAGEKGDFARFERSLNNTPRGYQVVRYPTTYEGLK